MPDKDGFQILKEVKNKYPSIPIIIISGHVSLTNNFALAKEGADAFLEKPFSLATLINTIEKTLVTSEETTTEAEKQFLLNNLVVTHPNSYQRTLAKNSVLTGIGLHTGESTGVIISPAEEDHGIVFEDITTGKRRLVHFSSIISSNYATSISLDKENTQTVTVIEHLLSAMNAYNITNAIIKVNRELPIMDGSAIDFCRLIEKAGIVEQSKLRKILIIDKEYEYIDEKNSNKWIKISPCDNLEIDYTLALPSIKQNYKIKFSEDIERRIEQFLSEIAPARTFGFMEELKGLQSMGLGKGGNLKNFLLINENKVINQKLKYENEFARHKVLDILGDMKLLGYDIKGKITANETGHRHNLGLIKKILLP